MAKIDPYERKMKKSNERRTITISKGDVPVSIDIINPRPASEENDNISDMDYVLRVLQRWDDKTAFVLRENMEIDGIKEIDVEKRMKKEQEELIVTFHRCDDHNWCTHIKIPKGDYADSIILRGGHMKEDAQCLSANQQEAVLMKMRRSITRFSSLNDVPRGWFNILKELEEEKPLCTEICPDPSLVEEEIEKLTQETRNRELSRIANCPFKNKYKCKWDK